MNAFKPSLRMLVGTACVCMIGSMVGVPQYVLASCYSESYYEGYYESYYEAAYVATGESGNVSPTSATLFGTIIGDGGSAITQHGFATSTDPGLGSSVSTTSLGSGSIGGFSGSVLLNAADTTFYYRAYAQNSNGIVYGQIRSFYSGNTTPSRTIRLFGGQKVKFYDGTIIFYQK